MISNPLVSIIIPIYNVEKYLEDCVKSVLDQTYKNIEVILVDDGSPDKCPEICDRLAKNFVNIIVIHKQNGGLSEARNIGISHSQGEYMLFLDSDDTLPPGAIQGLVDKAKETDADVIIPDRYLIVNELTNERVQKLHFDEEGYINDPISFSVNVIIGKGRAWRATALLYKAKLIKDNNIEFPVGKIAEDIIFNLKIMSIVKKIDFYNKSTLNNLKRIGSITSSFHENLDKTYLYIDKQVEEYFLLINKNDKYSNDKRDELLSRNTILFITDIYSKKCNWKTKDRIKKSNDVLNNSRINQSFNVKSINPYFDNILAIYYCKIMFFLLKRDYRKAAYLLASLRGKFQ